MRLVFFFLFQIDSLKSQLEQDLKDQCAKKQTLSTMLDEKCEIIAHLEKQAIDCEQLEKHHNKEKIRMASEYELKTKEVAESLSVKVSELESVCQMHLGEILDLKNKLQTEEISKQKVIDELNFTRATHSEQQNQLKSHQEFQISEISKQYESKITELDALLIQKSQEMNELCKKASDEAEVLKKSSELATEQALQDQKNLFNDMLQQANLEKCQLEENLKERCLSEQRLSSALSEKCEMIVHLEKQALDSKNLEKHLTEEKNRIDSEYDLKIREITKNFSVKVSELESACQIHFGEILDLKNKLQTEEENKKKLQDEHSILILNHTEEQRQLLTHQESQLTHVSQQFESKIAELEALLVRKSLEFDELSKKTNTETEDLKTSAKLATEQALQEQKKRYTERLDQVDICTFS